MSGDCFEVALGLALELDATLVHGTVIAPGVERHWHAWVEQHRDCPPIPDDFDPAVAEHYRAMDHTVAIDNSNGNRAILPRHAYRTLGQADVIATYTAAEARSLAFEHRHYGPWVADPEGVTR